MPMTFTIAPPGTPLGLTAAREPKTPGPLAAAPIGDFRKGRIAGGPYEIVWALTEDGKWAFEMTRDGIWKIGHVETRTVVKSGPRTLRAARVYVGSGKAAAELKRIQDKGKENSNGD